VSSTLGLALASAAIVTTRVLVSRRAWARRLHAELRPVALGLSSSHILLLAGLSSLGEELLFRGLLVPWIGVPASALLFGVAHQIRGPSRWVWIAWATVVGAMLGSIFALTGSLVGSVIAHALINGVNLAFLRDHDFASDRTASSTA
jgi:membrane protease YdiL (CAAX protease family)